MSVPQGWHPDGFGRHELRYYDMYGAPTGHVWDGGQGSYELPPPPTVTRTPSPPERPAAAPADRGASLWMVATPPVVADAPPPVAPTSHQEGAVPPDGRGGHTETWAAAVVSPRTRRRGLVVTAVTLPAVIVVALVVGVGRGAPAVPGAGLVPAAFVTSSARATLQHRTADVVITGSVTGAGQTVPLTGTGQADFTRGSFSADVSAQARGRSIEERELVVAGHFYLGVTVAGHDISSITSGRHWIEIPVPIGGTSTSLGSGTADPLSQLQLLTEEGNTVRPLGTAVIGGVTASGFAITPSPQAVRAAIQKAIASGKIPSILQQQLQQTELDPASYTFDAWFDASGLMRRMTISFQPAGSPGTGGSIIMTFEDYGTPVSVSAPDPGDVISYADFFTALQASNAPLT